MAKEALIKVIDGEINDDDNFKSRKEVKKMKRYSLFLIILSLILVAGLTQGCSDKASPTEPAELKGEISTSETEPTAALSPGEIYRARPIPDIDVSPTSLDFGDVKALDQPPSDSNHPGDKSLDVRVANTGTATLFISELKIVNSADAFAAFHIHRYTSSGACLREIDGITFRATIRPGEVCGFKVSFLPISATYYDHSYLSIRSNDPDEGTIRVPLSGRGYSYNLPGDIPRFEIDPHIPTPR